MRAIIVGLILSLGLGAAALYLYWCFRYMMVGRKENRFDQLPKRMAHFFKYVLGQARTIREPAGLLHFFVFWGFIVLQFETVEYMIQGFFPHFHGSDVIGLSAANGIMFIQDMMGLMVALAICALFVRRFIIRPQHAIATLDALIIQGLILGLMVTKFLANGGHIAVAPNVAELGWDLRYTPVATWTADVVFGGTLRGISAPGWSEALIFVSYVLHLGIVAFFANWVPRGKHMHVITAMPNVFFRKLEPQGALYPIDLENEDAESFGAGKLEDLSWKQLLDAYTCTECGRCEHYCPAYNTGKSLNPMMIIHKVQDHMREKGLHVTRKGGEDNYPPLAGGIISAEELWACTTCGACVSNCPVFIEHVDTIVDMRRYLTLTEAEFPPELGPFFRNIENASNPWGLPRAKRGDWRQGLEFEIPLLSECEEKPEYLFFVGCSGSFDDRQKKVTSALARLLNAAGVSYAILGKEEGCTGDPARRVGNEYLYWQCATENIETMNGYGVTKVVTSCPHCFHTIAKEYPQLGGNYEVVHHTHLLSQLIEDGKLQLRPGATQQRITYHDSCYIGRWNSDYDKPRAILQAIDSVDLVEMDKNRRTAMCCGAGGGRMWMEEDAGQRVNVARADQALEKAPDIVAVGCPFCMTMLTDGVAHRGADDRVQTRDIAEILIEHVRV
jgi:Fe-S oxidoreductase